MKTTLAMAQTGPGRLEARELPLPEIDEAKAALLARMHTYRFPLHGAARAIRALAREIPGEEAIHAPGAGARMTVGPAGRRGGHPCCTTC